MRQSTVLQNREFHSRPNHILPPHCDAFSSLPNLAESAVHFFNNCTMLVMVFFASPKAIMVFFS